MAGAVGFEPTIHDTKNRCLTTWPRPNLDGCCNLATKCLAINPVLASGTDKMCLICSDDAKDHDKLLFVNASDRCNFVAFAQTPALSNAVAAYVAASISSKMPKQLAPLPDI